MLQLHDGREHITFAIEYLYSWIKTFYIRAFNYLIPKALNLCTFKSDMLPMEALMVLLEGEEAAEAVSSSVGMPTLE